MKKTLILFSILLLLVDFSFAVDFVPSGNIVGRNVYGIYNFTNISGIQNITAVRIFQNGSQVLDNTTVISVSNFSSYTNVSNLNVNTTTMKTTGGLLDVVYSFWSGLFLNSTAFDASQLAQNNTISTKADNATLLNYVNSTAFDASQLAQNNTINTKLENGSDATLSNIRLDQLFFNLSLNVTSHQEGKVHWNLDDGTLDYDTNFTGTSVQLGQENVVKVVNKAGVDLDDGTPVYVSGAQGNRPKVGLATNDNESRSYVLGLTTMNIKNNEEGLITTEGLVRDWDTTNWSVGDQLYLDGAGTLTNVKPTGPKHGAKIGFVISSHSTQGSVYVHVQNGWETYELHDVNGTEPNADGLFLVWDNTTRTYNPKQILNYTNTTTFDASQLAQNNTISTKADNATLLNYVNSTTFDASQLVQNNTISTKADNATLLGYLPLDGSSNMTGNIDFLGGAGVNASHVLNPPWLYSGSVGWTNLSDYPVACPANTFMTQVGDSITCTSVQETLLSLLVNGNLTVLGNTSSLSVNGNLAVLGNITTNKISFNNASIKQLPQNANIDGGVIGIMLTNPPNQELPHMILQSGGPSQASVILRSLMIQNEINNFSNTTDATDCMAYMSNIGETLKIDCNTTTTGADLLISDDLQVIGDVWSKDTGGQWRSLNNVQTHLAEMQIGTLLDSSRSTLTLTGSVLNFTLFADDGSGFWNINGTIYPTNGIGVNNATVALLNGTDANPKTNYIHFYLNAGVPTLTTTEAYPSYDHIDVATFKVGNVNATNYTIYAYDRNRYEIDSFVKKVIERFEEQGALYVSGFSQATSTKTINVSPGYFFNGITEMFTNITINSTNNGFYRINSTGAFLTSSTYDAATFSQYQTGEAITNNRYVNVVWGIVPTTTVSGGSVATVPKLVAVIQSKPATEYNSVALAEQDLYGMANYYPSDSVIKNVFTPVARQVLLISTGGGGTATAQTLSNGALFIDIRGKTTSAGGAPIPSSSDHAVLSNLAYATSGHTGFLAADGSTPLTANWSANFNISAPSFFGNINSSYVQNAAWSAGNITAGTFGTGNYVFDTNVTVQTLIFETNTSGNMIYDNASCTIIKGSTSTLAIC